MEVTEALQKVRDLSSTLHQQTTALPPLNPSAPASEGISLLQAKTATLMRYNRNLLRLAHARVLGLPIPTLAEQLVRDWVALEKLRPLERALRHQIDTLLKTASRPAGTRSDADRHRPDPSALVVDSDSEAGSDGAGVYRPPRIAEVVYDPDGERRAAREKRERERKQKRAVRSEGVRELLAEVKGLPEEIRDSELGGGRKSAAVQRLLREDERRREFEEENFTRLNVTRKDKKRRRELERAMEGPSLDGTDEFAGLVAVADRVVGGKGAGDGGKGERGRGSREEEEFQVRQLDEITERMTGSANKSSKSARKRRKR